MKKSARSAPHCTMRFWGRLGLPQSIGEKPSTLLAPQSLMILRPFPSAAIILWNERKMNKNGNVALTEQRNPRSRNLDEKSTLEILRIINREDLQVARAVRREIPKIARAVDEIAARLLKGGRLFYLGAGTSGRLGVLDASEIRPTFGTPASMVQGIIAGGSRALTSAVEGAEDSAP